MWSQDILNELDAFEQKAQKRELFTVRDADKRWLTMKGRRLLNLASNNYLGLSGHERLKAAAIRAITEYGVGATASRLIVGNHPLYEKAENALKIWKRAEASLILHSGYAANIGILSAVIGRNGVVFSDKFNHASIVDGSILSRAEHKRYRHNDMTHLEALLKKTPKDKRKLIVTDTIFSMDGDKALLLDLVTLKERYNAILMVDEAHGSGVYGPNGEGYSYEVNLQGKIDILMGTFSKAMGCYGAYVTGEPYIIDYLKNKMRSFIFSTGLPPMILASIQEAIYFVQEEPDRRERLQTLSDDFREALSLYGFDTCNSTSQIIPLRIGSNEKTIEFSERLQEAGIAAIAVRPPTVPNGEARIRFALTSEHDAEELAWAVDKIASVGKELGVIL
ncbi:8-amino-7-oxononanoate synthase [Halalkalibacterium ligniniphilum]|uniref:8-amino-7-oxononanoate synthase n=1 Tax=Halalkalibacterium ligniniphilum TaxID=1134413 RepID=UPI00034BBAB1|nr:8-amino-7-oxononanoate synthase [Halalkalibacterium ligniniphilum]